jgi:hypothetical protein
MVRTNITYYYFLNSGRALDAVVRTYAAKVAGDPTVTKFDLKNLEYCLEFLSPREFGTQQANAAVLQTQTTEKSNVYRRKKSGKLEKVTSIDTNVPSIQIRPDSPYSPRYCSEIFIPNFHYGDVDYLHVQVSDGEWKYDRERQTLYWWYDPVYIGSMVGTTSRRTQEVSQTATSSLWKTAANFASTTISYLPVGQSVAYAVGRATGLLPSSTNPQPKQGVPLRKEESSDDFQDDEPFIRHWIRISVPHTHRRPAPLNLKELPKTLITNPKRAIQEIAAHAKEFVPGWGYLEMLYSLGKVKQQGVDAEDEDFSQSDASLTSSSYNNGSIQVNGQSECDQRGRRFRKNERVCNCEIL